jgi:hypothetical protein
LSEVWCGKWGPSALSMALLREWRFLMANTTLRRCWLVCVVISCRVPFPPLPSPPLPLPPVSSPSLLRSDHATTYAGLWRAVLDNGCLPLTLLCHYYFGDATLPLPRPLTPSAVDRECVKSALNSPLRTLRFSVFCLVASPSVEPLSAHTRDRRSFPHFCLCDCN